MTSMRLATAMIFVKDFERMLAFYRDGLGLAVKERQDGWAALDGGVSLHAIPEKYAADIVIASPPVAREDTPIKLIFEAHDVVAARAKLAEHGAVMMEPRRNGSCDGLDPEGNVFQIARRP
jgi:catechol 2,3-dioxygenase-like lactoylglutathione lyase family enzyme